MKKLRLVLRRARLLLPAVAFMGIAGCKSGTEKAVLAFVGEGSCPTRNAVLDAKEDEVLVGQAPSCPQKHAFIEQDTCKKLTGDGPCVAHGRAAKEGPDAVDYCLTKSADTFKLDAGCTAAAALVRQYFAADGCDERAKLLFAPDENKEQLALLKSRQKSCKADIKSLDLTACAGTLHAKEGRCVAKTTFNDGKVAEVCVRRDNDKLSVDLRCTEMLDGADGRRVVVKVVKNYNRDFSEKDYVSVDLAISELNRLRVRLGGWTRARAASSARPECGAPRPHRAARSRLNSRGRSWRGAARGSPRGGPSRARRCVHRCRGDAPRTRQEGVHERTRAGECGRGDSLGLHGLEVGSGASARGPCARLAVPHGMERAYRRSLAVGRHGGTNSRGVITGSRRGKTVTR